MLATPTTPQGSYYILLQRAVVSTLSAKPALPAVSPLFNPAVPCHVPSRLSLSQPVGLPTPAYTCLHLPACLPAGLTPSPSPTSQAPMPVQHTVKACLKARSTSPFYTELTNDTWVQPSYASPLSYQNQACRTKIRLVVRRLPVRLVVRLYGLPVQPRFSPTWHDIGHVRTIQNK